MARSQSGSVEAKHGKCNCETSDGLCENPAGADGTCHYDSHTDPVPVTPDRSDAADVTDDVRDAWGVIAEHHADGLEEYADRTEAPVPDDPAERAALVFGRKLPGNSWRTAFGPCSRDGCDRGATGFTAETCDEHEPAVETDDETDDDMMTVEIDGREVTGDRETIMDLLGK